MFSCVLHRYFTLKFPVKVLHWKKSRLEVWGVVWLKKNKPCKTSIPIFTITVRTKIRPKCYYRLIECVNDEVEDLMVLLLNCARLTGCHSTSRNERISVLCFERIKYVSATLTCLRRLKLSQRLMSNTHFTSIMKMSPVKLLTPLEPAPYLLARVH